MLALLQTVRPCSEMQADPRAKSQELERTRAHRPRGVNHGVASKGRVLEV